jgi:hypothetical protein
MQRVDPDRLIPAVEQGVDMADRSRCVACRPGAGVIALATRAGERVHRPLARAAVDVAVRRVTGVGLHKLVDRRLDVGEGCSGLSVVVASGDRRQRRRKRRRDAQNKYRSDKADRRESWQRKVTHALLIWSRKRR